ncbi:uncharacterized protein DUF3145 [Nocardia pseudobrasiliensis]|uniref:Uncharacterized protein DUF3145 n=1 Tax=Nocardia pseudobrasiliensis TaxID=45979 RepID=A0A370I066_9NOCA|nr:DUF3145 family protein [Nocardia pseudobrasiliensis]RDI64145.1 uncharacterized protein DUF3145 [Nocardia pseudobrasiliensis]
MLGTVADIAYALGTAADIAYALGTAADIAYALGTAWDDELEPYRSGGEGAEVTWLRRDVV